MLQKITHIESRRVAAKASKERIMRLLEWSELQYCDFQYRMGLEFLQEYIPGDPYGIAYLERHPVFWAWWRNQWTLRDEIYLNSDISTVRLRLRQNIYIQNNNPRALAQGITPPAVVLDDSYAQMIQETFKEPLL